MLSRDPEGQLMGSGYFVKRVLYETRVAFQCLTMIDLAALLRASSQRTLPRN